MPTDPLVVFSGQPIRALRIFFGLPRYAQGHPAAELRARDFKHLPYALCAGVWLGPEYRSGPGWVIDRLIDLKWEWQDLHM